MQEFFTNGRLFDLILLIMVAEGVALIVYRRWTGSGLSVKSTITSLCAGGFLVLAARAAVVAAWWGWIALCLLAALLSHVLDLKQRWK